MTVNKAYRGEEFLFAVEITTESGKTLVRPFNQTDGSDSAETDKIELKTKDGTGADYGDTSRSLSLEGVITQGDPFIDYMDDAIENKEFIRIHKINTRTKESKNGLYMISNFEESYSHGDFATYSLEAGLNGKRKKETLQTIPAGAQMEETQPPSGS
ncbi:phage major tail protein, TP901-1 family [Bacillus cereus]|nr:phage major tail protein, TP901-1 family [Bacillus cereus]